MYKVFDVTRFEFVFSDILGDSGSSSRLILPIHRLVLLYFTVLSIFLSIFLTLDYCSNVFASSQQIVITNIIFGAIGFGCEGVAFFLLQHGVGVKALRICLTQAFCWGLFVFIVRSFAMALNTGQDPESGASFSSDVQDEVCFMLLLSNEKMLVFIFRLLDAIPWPSYFALSRMLHSNILPFVRSSSFA